MPNIVQVNVSQTIAPTPETLQQSGAFISQGGTTTAVNATTLLTQQSDLTAILKAPAAITSLAWASSVVTVTTAVPHGIANGVTFPVTIAGAAPAGYNGAFTGTATGASTFTYPLVANPGANTTPGTWQPTSAIELTAMATTFFAQGSSVAVSVLELGYGSPANGVTALTAYINNNPNSNYTPGALGFFYSYLVPRSWASEATYLTMLASYESTTARTYFFTTVTLGNYASFTALMKCVFAEIEAPTVPVTEFSAAASFYDTLRYDPSPTNKVSPLAFTYQFGVTPYPAKNNNATLTALKAAGINYVGTGAEGGISNACLFWGTTMDLRDFTYWYSVDWVQINEDIAISNEIINGSNNPINPLYYNQDGINRLQGRAAKVMGSGVQDGLVLGTVVQTSLTAAELAKAIDNGDFAGKAAINAQPFVAYTSAQPSDYKNGKYAGLTAIYTPARGFTQIIFNLNVTDFVAA